jgi:hypothetical protein
MTFEFIRTQNGRYPQFLGEWKTTSFFLMEDDLNYFQKWKSTLFSKKKGRQPECFGNLKTNSILF